MRIDREREELELLADGSPAPQVEAMPGEAFAQGLGAQTSPVIRAVSGTSAERARVSLMRSLQRGAGNQAVLAIMRRLDEQGEVAPAADAEQTHTLEEDFVPDDCTEIRAQPALATVDPGDAQAEPGAENQAAAPRVTFVDGGRSGTARYGDPNGGPLHAPRAFTNGGQTATVAWAGGGGAGAHGNEAVGSVQAQVAPVYESAANATPPKFDGWVRSGTGTVSVTRSWTGINAGDQGNGYFVTAGAATRINSHETQHVSSSSGLYTAHLTPLEARVLAYKKGGSGLNIGTTAPDATGKVKTAVGWEKSIKDFQDADRAANTPMGPVDTADLASGTYPVDAGPGTVAGKVYAHRVRKPGEANPAP